MCLNRTKDTIFGSIQGPMVNYIIKVALDRGIKLNRVTIALTSFILQKSINKKHNIQLFADHPVIVNNRVPIYPIVYYSFTSYDPEYEGWIDNYFPPTDKEYEEITKLISMDELSNILMFINILKDVDLLDHYSLNDVVKQYQSELNIIRDIVDLNIDQTVPAFPFEDIDAFDILHYRYYSLFNKYTIEDDTLIGLIHMLSQYYGLKHTKYDISAIRYHAEQECKKIIKNKDLEKSIYILPTLEYFQIIDPLLKLGLTKKAIDTFDTITKNINTLLNYSYIEEENNNSVSIFKQILIKIGTLFKRIKL